MASLARKLLRVFRHRMRTRRRIGREAGMTMVEILIVVAIIAMIVGTVSISGFKLFAKSKIDGAKRQIANLNQAVATYRLQNNSDCPKSLDDLATEKIIPKVPLDPWGQPFLFTCPKEGDEDAWEIVSKGPDKKENTSDDIRMDN